MRNSPDQDGFDLSLLIPNLKPVRVLTRPLTKMGLLVKKITRVAKKIIFISWAFRLGFPPPAHAYLNPGSGSYLAQLVIASLLGGVFALKAYWKQILTFVTNLFHQRQSNETGKG